MVSIGQDKCIYLWNLVTNEVDEMTATIIGRQSYISLPVNCCRINYNGNILAIGTIYFTLRLY